MAVIVYAVNRILGAWLGANVTQEVLEFPKVRMDADASTAIVHVGGVLRVIAPLKHPVPCAPLRSSLHSVSGQTRLGLLFLKASATLRMSVLQFLIRNNLLIAANTAAWEMAVVPFKNALANHFKAVKPGANRNYNGFSHTWRSYRLVCGPSLFAVGSGHFHFTPILKEFYA
jgi:hypothetical protein